MPDPNVTWALGTRIRFISAPPTHGPVFLRPLKTIRPRLAFFIKIKRFGQLVVRLPDGTHLSLVREHELNLGLSLNPGQGIQGLGKMLERINEPSPSDSPDERLLAERALRSGTKEPIQAVHRQLERRPAIGAVLSFSLANDADDRQFGQQQPQHFLAHFSPRIFFRNRDIFIVARSPAP
jgi:hypothetical protein